MAVRGALGALALASVLLGGAAQAGEPLGTWQVPGGAILIRIAACGASLCGMLLDSPRLKAEPNARDDKNKNPALRARPLRGISMLTGFKGGPPAWVGSIYLPGSGDTYRATMTSPDADTLSLKVCPVGPLCKTQALKRVK
jgi:uncharacterized protein (DUF2147 family)